MKKLLIALCLGLFSITQTMQASEKTHSYDEQKDLVEIHYISGYREPGEILVNLVSVEGLCFEEEFSFGKVKNGWQCKIVCCPIEDHVVIQDGRALQRMEIFVTATIPEEPGKVEVEVSSSMRFSSKVNEEGVATQMTQRNAITSTVTCPDLLVSERPMYYCHNDSGSDVSIGFVHQ